MDRQTDIQTDMMKLIVAFRNCFPERDKKRRVFFFFQSSAAISILKVTMLLGVALVLEVGYYLNMMAHC